MVQESFHKIVPIISEVGQIFYSRLFETAPELQELFSNAFGQDGNKAQVITEVVNSHLRSLLSKSVTNSRVTISPAMRELGRRHEKYGVTSAHFTKMKEALIWTLRLRLGDDFPADLEEVWRSAFDDIALMMQQAIAERHIPETPEGEGIFARIANQTHEHEARARDAMTSFFKQRNA
jgi:hemoglobin-like flavoprotein